VNEANTALEMARAHEARAIEALERSVRMAALEAGLVVLDRALLHPSEDAASTGSLWIRVGTAFLLLGAPARALAAFNKAANSDMRSREARLGQVECLLALGQHTQAMQRVQPLLDDVPDGWVLAALGAESGGLMAQMTTLLARAEVAAPTPFVAPHRRECFDDVRALDCMHRRELPDEALGGPLAQLARVTLGRFEAAPRALVRPLDEALAQRALQRMLLAGHLDRLLHLLDERATALLPVAGRLLERTVASLGQVLAP
jgi:tetratricopeptide (TPR) repeat protein